jgi:putative NADH-flavin reductase
MKLTIFGGTGGVGSKLVKQALEAGHEVTVVVRDGAKVAPHERLKVLVGSLEDEALLSEAIEGADAVLSALGARTNTPDQPDVFAAAMLRITQAMKRCGVRRLVSISGAGVFMPDDTITFDRRLVRMMLRLFAKHVSESKEREWAVIRESGLDWVLVRPPRIVEGEATGSYRVLPDRVPSSKISQGDVAHLMLSGATSDEWVGRCPIPGY